LYTNSGLEISISLPKEISFSNEDWLQLINDIKTSYKVEGKKMKEIHNHFEKWHLFINPYNRLFNVLSILVERLKVIELTNESHYSCDASKDERNKYWETYKNWIERVNLATTYSTTIRMLSPVLCEAFINLLILVIAKKEIKNDKRLYSNYIRQEVDIRVKTLHLNCDGFKKPIDFENQIFKDFQTLMNGRNDFLHGNVDPLQLKFDEVYFDKGNIPLFNEDESLMKRFLRNYNLKVEPENAVNDFKVANEFVNFVIKHLNSGNEKSIRMLLETRNPGINDKDNRIGILFPNIIAELY
jgi:hypothetical protein